MIKLLITWGGTTRDYTKYLDGSSVSIEEKINIPAQCTFALTPSDRTFVLPPQRAYVSLVSTQYDRSLFSGFIASEPVRTFQGVAGFANGTQLFQYGMTCTSDDYLLNIKAVPFIPAFINRTQGQILSQLAEILCPGFFDSSGIASGDLVPFFEYTPTQGWSEIAKQFGDGSRYRYKVRDRKIWYQPYGDQPYGIVYDETQPPSTFNARDLKTEVLTVPIVNDVTIIGDAEAGNNREDYFIGDGFTGNFPLLHQVFHGASTVLLQESWNNTALNTQQWFLLDPGNNFDFSAGALNLTDTLSIPFTLGESYVSMNNGIELAGGIDLEAGEIIFTDICEGVIGGAYLDSSFIEGVLLAGFKVSSPSGVVTSASGCAGVNIQPWCSGSGPVGVPLITEVNHSYVLQMVITAPKYVRFTQAYRTVEGEEFGGGATDEVLGNVTFSIQDFSIAAATGFFYTPNVTTWSVANMPLPAFAAFALINNKKLNLSLTNTTVATMPLGALSALIGPSGLYSPTGLILPMLPPDSGGFVGTVQPWPSPASANILLDPGLLGATPHQQVLGNGFQLQAAQITSGNEADTLAFYAQSLPAAGTPIRFQSFEEQAAVSRLQDQQSILDEAFVVGDDGIRSAIVTDLNPLPRTSEDCDNAGLAFLADRVGVFYNGTYTCSSYFFQGLSTDEQFFPTVGRFLDVNSPARGIVNQKYLVVDLTIKMLDMMGEVLEYTTQFGADTFLDKVLKNFVDLAPPSVLSPTDKATPPNPRFTQNVDNSFLPDLSNVQVDQLSISAESFLVEVFDSYYGPIEVRRLDTNWGKGPTPDLIGVFSGPTFTLQRRQYDQVWYMRPVQDGITSRRSKVIRVRYPLIPSTPTFIGAQGVTAPGGPSGSVINTVRMQLDFNGDLRSIYGFELRAADDATVLVQTPVASFADLLIDLSVTPFPFLTGVLANDYNLTAYFFNQHWEYSDALELEADILIATTPRLPYPWKPLLAGVTGTPFSSGLFITGSSFGIQTTYVLGADNKQQAGVLINGTWPVNQVSQGHGEAQPPLLLTATVSPTGGFIPGGVDLVVGMTALDTNSEETSLSNLLQVSVPMGTNTNSIVLTFELFPHTFQNVVYMGFSEKTLRADDVGLGLQTSPLTLTMLTGDFYGPPDPLYSRTVFRVYEDLHAGAWADELHKAEDNGDGTGFLTYSGNGGTITNNFYNGSYLSLLANWQAKDLLAVPPEDFLVLSSSGNRFHVTPTPISGLLSGTVTTNGLLVTWQSGNTFPTLLGGIAGQPITINGVDYTVARVTGIHTLLLTTSAGVQASPVAYSSYRIGRIPGDVMTMRSVASIVGPSLIGCSGYISPYATGGLTPHAEFGNIARIIRGTGAGQARPIIDNDMVSFMVASPWDVVPDNTSFFVVLAPTNQPDVSTPVSKIQTQPEIQAAFGFPTFQVPLPNLTGFTAFIEGICVDQSNNMCLEGDSPFREIFLWGASGASQPLQISNGGF